MVMVLAEVNKLIIANAHINHIMYACHNNIAMAIATYTFNYLAIYTYIFSLLP